MKCSFRHYVYRRPETPTAGSPTRRTTLIWTAAGVTELDLAVAPKADQERPHPAPSYIPVDTTLAVDIQLYLMATSGRS